MATLKRIEKRMNDVESWVKEFEKGTGPAQVMDNMSWLLTQLRMTGERLQSTEQNLMQLQQGMQSNTEIVQGFVEKNDLVHDWQAHLAEIQKENEDALQEQETESLDAQEQAGDGEEMGEGDA